MSPYGPSVSEDARKKADEAKAKFMDGSMIIYRGPLKDNKGNQIIAAGVDQGQTDINLEKMGYLVEGVKGSVQ